MLANIPASKSMTQIDYTQRDVWQQLAALFDRALEPRPAAFCGRVRCDPNWTWRPQLVDYDLWFAIKGHGTMQLVGQTYPIRAGTLLCLRPGDTGWCVHDPADPLSVIYIHFDFYPPAQAKHAIVDAAWLPSRYIPTRYPAHIEMLLGRVVELMGTQQGLDHYEAKLVLQQALLAVYREDAMQRGGLPVQLDAGIKQVMTYVRSHPDARLTLRDAATMAGLSPDYFSRRFTSTVGTNFRTYTLHMRLERARYLLQETELPIGHIAQRLGYDDMFLFSRQFKQRYGASPRAARQPR